MKKKIFSLAIALMAAVTLSAQSWHGTWATAVEYTGQGDMPAKSLSNRSIRQVIRTSIAGETLRLQLSNHFGNDAVDIQSVFIANALDSCDIDIKSARYLTFNGKKNITIEAGKDIFSDELKYSLKPLQRIAVTICYGARTPEHATSHRGSRTTSYIIEGIAKPKTSFGKGAERLAHWYNIAALDVKAPEGTPVIAAIGNSITDGRGTTTDLQNRWPDRMAEALGGNTGVLNLGIGGNAVLGGGISEPALVRFDRDILGQRGVSTVIIYEGVNDIGTVHEKDPKGGSAIRAERLIEAYKTLIDKAKNAGKKVYISTICPFKGHSFYTHFHEAARQTVNDWIRSQTIADGIIDFDAQVRDPHDPARLRKEYSDDWLHLNPAGYEAMGRYAATVLSK